jgi:glycosyltransferase involved in cell wall biosynthesis
LDLTGSDRADLRHEERPSQVRAPLVSIVVPTYNSARYLASTVDSVTAQTFENWELVLIDDGSSDNTVQLSQQLAAGNPKIRAIAGSHGGPAVARNEGLRHSDPRSEFVIFLDSDDRWEGKALETLLQALKDNPGCVAAHGLARATDLQGARYEGDDLADLMRRRRAVTPNGLTDVPVSEPTTFFAMLVYNWIVTPGTCLIRRSALDKVGAFAPELSLGEDWDLNIRLARAGNLALVDCIVLNWRRHPGSLLSKSRRARWAHLLVRRRTIRSAFNSPEQRRAALDIMRAEWRSSWSTARAAMSDRDLRRLIAQTRYGAASFANYWWLRLRY